MFTNISKYLQTERKGNNMNTKEIPLWGPS